MNSLWSFIVAHQVAATLIVGCAIDSMPDPTPQSSAFYTWLFKFTHALSLRLRTAWTASNADRRGAPSAT